MRRLGRSAAMAATVVVILLFVLVGIDLIRDGEALGGVLVLAVGSIASVVGGRLFARLLEHG